MLFYSHKLFLVVLVSSTLALTSVAQSAKDKSPQSAKPSQADHTGSSRTSKPKPASRPANSLQPHQSSPIQPVQSKTIQPVNNSVQPYHAQEVKLYHSQPVQPYQAEQVQPYQARQVQPHQSQPVQPHQSQPVQPHQSQPVQPYRAQQVQRNGHQQSSASNSAPAARGERSFFHTFGLAVPGVAYTVDNYAADTRTMVTSTGAVTSSAVRINPDHTYDWNSAWDGKMIHGRWTEKDGGYLLLHGQESKDWLLRSMDRPSGKATVTLWDQNATWYNGTPLN